MKEYAPIPEKLLAHIPRSIPRNVIIKMVRDGFRKSGFSKGGGQTHQESLDKVSLPGLRELHGKLDRSSINQDVDLGAQSGDVRVNGELLDGLSPDGAHVRPPFALLPVLMPCRCHCLGLLGASLIMFGLLVSADTNPSHFFETRDSFLEQLGVKQVNKTKSFFKFKKKAQKKRGKKDSFCFFWLIFSFPPFPPLLLSGIIFINLNFSPK